MLTSWKTTLAGLVAAIGTALTASSDPTLHTIGVIIMALGSLFLGLSARDFDKSSGDQGLVR